MINNIYGILKMMKIIAQKKLFVMKILINS